MKNPFVRRGPPHSSAPDPNAISANAFYSIQPLGALQPQAQWLAITPYATASEWFMDSIHTVSRLGHLEDGWDSYGSPALTHMAKARALQVLICLERQPVPGPHVAPVPGGGISMDWSSGSRALELEVLPDGSVEFLRVYDSDRMEEGLIPPDRLDYLREQAAWLTQHPA